MIINFLVFVTVLPEERRERGDERVRALQRRQRAEHPSRCRGGGGVYG